MILVTRRRAHAPTIAYLERRIREGKSQRESNPLPQALPRPQPLPAPRDRTAATDLTNIEASLGQPSVTSPLNLRSHPEVAGSDPASKAPETARCVFSTWPARDGPTFVYTPASSRLLSVRPRLLEGADRDHAAVSLPLA